MSENDVDPPARRAFGRLESVLSAVIGMVSVANFIRIDSTSHSVSDTLINFVPETAILVLAGVIIAAAVRRRSERQRA